MREPHIERLKARSFVCRWFQLSAFAVVLLVSGGAEAQTDIGITSGSPRLTARSSAVMPVPGWIRFCRQRPDECRVSSPEPATIPLTPQAWDSLNRINRQVNDSIIPITDHEHWGVEDRWDLAEDGYGDCEDFQLLKRKRLVADGFPEGPCA